MNKTELIDAMAADAIRRGIRCLSGHFRFHEGIYENTKNDRVYTTILRDPVPEAALWRFPGTAELSVDRDPASNGAATNDSTSDPEVET